MQRSALQKIFDYNVMKFADGNMGAVNGITSDGKLIMLKDNQQVREVWTGTTMGVAGLMLSEGMTEQAYRTLWGLYHTSYETKGYWFRTPEAWDITGRLPRLHVHEAGSHLDDGINAERASRKIS